jgi:hypothetical protein
MVVVHRWLSLRCADSGISSHCASCLHGDASAVVAGSMMVLITTDFPPATDLSDLRVLTHDPEVQGHPPSLTVETTPTKTVSNRTSAIWPSLYVCFTSAQHSRTPILPL